MDGFLLAGVCIYPTDGPFAVVEYSSTNPDIQPRLAHRAALALIHGLRVYGALRMKSMLCFPRDRSILRMLDKAGFIRSPAICVYHPPLAMSGFSFERKEAPPESAAAQPPLEGSGGASLRSRRKR